MPEHPHKGKYVFLAIYLAAVSFLGFGIDRTETFVLITTYTTAFASFLFVLQIKDQDRLLTSAGILARLLLFFNMPSLSDDVYRFIWDGTLISNNLNPYAELPTFYLSNTVGGLSNQLFELLNSPRYFTIYPPLNQAFFWLAVEIGSPSWLFETNVLRLILLIADIAALLFLKRLLRFYGRSEHLAFFYFLNPLVVLEFTGNLHFEGLVICFLLAGIYLYETKKKWLSASAFGLAIATKLLPLIYLPYLFLKGLKNQKWQVPILAGVIGAGSLFPLLSPTLLKGISESIDLYFHSFEFNASIYFLAREIGFWLTGYNQIAVIGTYLAILTILAILLTAWIGTKNNWQLPKAFLMILSLYLLFATTVHPWYILPLLAFGILAGYNYPLLWTFFIFLTYGGYQENGFELPALVIVVEYVSVILIACIEIYNKKAIEQIFSIHTLTKRM